MNACDAIMNAWWQRWFDLEIMTGYPSSLKKRGPTPLEDTVVLLGKRIFHYRVDSSMKINERKTKSWIDIEKFWNVFELMVCRKQTFWLMTSLDQTHWGWHLWHFVIRQTGNDTWKGNWATSRHPTYREMRLSTTPSSAKMGNDNFDINAKNWATPCFLIKQGMTLLEERNVNSSCLLFRTDRLECDKR